MDLGKARDIPSPKRAGNLNVALASNDLPLIAQAWHGNPAPKRSASSGDAPRQELQEWLGAISTRHERTTGAAEEEARSFVRAIRDDSVRRPGNPLRIGATEQEIREFAAAILPIQEADWNPAKHPRRGSSPNPGWFAPTGGTGGAPKGTSEPGRTRSNPDRAGGSLPDFRTESDPTPKTRPTDVVGRSRSASVGLAIDGGGSTSPFRLADFSLSAQEAGRVQTAIENLGIAVDRKDHNGVSTLTLKGQPTE